jgi:molybdopterin-guanine dinucleotide biosynthesis protein A
LGGLYTALSLTKADWNLLVACDMPELTPEVLEQLLAAARGCAGDALVPETPDGLQPLCAVYHVRLRAVAEAALLAKSLKMHDFVSSLNAVRWPAPEPGLFANFNTPEHLAL